MGRWMDGRMGGWVGGMTDSPCCFVITVPRHVAIRRALFRKLLVYNCKVSNCELRLSPYSSSSPSSPPAAGTSPIIDRPWPLLRFLSSLGPNSTTIHSVEDKADFLWIREYRQAETMR